MTGPLRFTWDLKNLKIEGKDYTSVKKTPNIFNFLKIFESTTQFKVRRSSELSIIYIIIPKDFFTLQKKHSQMMSSKEGEGVE